ncbi:DUF736 family protein [Bradyrhizobium sp. CCBAU 53340]|uniref:DUF736 family protein n=1 Tax=Bradyrhizobium sp. CCBAU 53340 TaxID=1325112 RepID=UPI001FEEFDAC|nr:DUF736 family protein [Bradyrhizobium sp. CCBAU 53340]
MRGSDPLATEEDKTARPGGTRRCGNDKGQLRTVSIRAEIDIIPNRDKSAETHPDFRVFTRGIKSGAAISAVADQRRTM